MLESLPRPIVIARRGASAHAPENTMAAFQMALDLGADAIELDARLTRDAKVAILHDPTLTRTTNGSGRLSDKTAAELRDLDAGSHFSTRYKGERVPLLEEVLGVFGKKILINIQLSSNSSHPSGFVEQVCELVVRHGLGEHVFFSSFYPWNLRRASQLLPQVPRALLAGRGWKGVWARSFGFSFGDYAALHAHVIDMSPRHVQRVHRLGRKVHVGTINDASDVVRVSSWGVDGIFTDDLKTALRALGRSL